jgi:cytochrome P450
MLADTIDFDRSKVRDIDLWDPALKADPGRTFMQWSTLDPFYIVHGGVPQAVVTRYDDARRALEDHSLFGNEKRNWPGMEKYRYWQGLPVVTDTDPPTHTKLRRLLAPAFSPRRLASIEEGVQAFISQRLDAIEAEGSGRFDLMTHFGRELSTHLLLGLLMDIKPEDRARFIGVSDGLTLFASLPAGSPPPPEYLAHWDSTRAYCEELIERRRREPMDDLVSNIIAAEAEGRLTTDELFATFIILFVAGISGIAHLIGWMLWRLCNNPDQMALLRADPELIKGAMEETLRIEPIGYTALRWAKADFEMSGLHFHENMPVMVVEGCSSFDPDRYEDTLRFDITRAVRRDSLAFGFGVHHCIGAPVARMATRHAVTALLARFPEIRLQDPDFRPAIVGGPKDRGPASIPLAV